MMPSCEAVHTMILIGDIVVVLGDFVGSSRLGATGPYPSKATL